MIIPIDTEDYRKQVVKSRKISEDQDEIPKETESAKDGVTARSLVSQMGNRFDKESI